MFFYIELLYYFVGLKSIFHKEPRGRPKRKMVYLKRVPQAPKGDVWKCNQDQNSTLQSPL